VLRKHIYLKTAVPRLFGDVKQHLSILVIVGRSFNKLYWLLTEPDHARKERKCFYAAYGALCCAVSHQLLLDGCKNPENVRSVQVVDWNQVSHQVSV